MLTELAIQMVDGPAPWEAILGACQAGRDAITAFAPLAFQAANAGDHVGLMICHHAADAQRMLIQTASRNLAKKDQPHLVALVGRLWQHPRFVENVRERLGPGFDSRLPELPAVAGCLAAAADRCGHSGRALLDALRSQLAKDP